MPYKLSEDGLTVLHADSGKPVEGGAHENHDEALAHLRALEANVSEAHKSLNKAVQDIPGLRHATDAADCGHCQFHRKFLEEHTTNSVSKDSSATSEAIPITYCAMYDSKVQCDWTCDDWQPEGAHPDAQPINANPVAAMPDDSYGLAQQPEMSKNSAAQVFRIFVPITKVDAEKQEVWGYAILEQPDHANEIMDYKSSKPYFDKWSQTVQKDTDGKSLGNVRAMHQAIAAGKLISFQDDDQNKGFYVGAKIVDHNEWQKVAEGVYSGFSVGGNYVRRWPPDQKGLVRYTADPVEISIVDRPCVPGATYTMVKGVNIEMKEFHTGDGTHVLPLAKAADLPTIAAPVESTATRGEAMKPTDADIQARVKVNERIEIHQTYMTALETTPDSPPTGAQAEQHYRPKMDVSAAAGKISSDTPPQGIAQKVKVIGEEPMSRIITKDDASGVLSQVKPIISAVQEQVGRGEVDRALLDQLAAALDVTVDEASHMHTEPTSGSSPTVKPSSVEPHSGSDSGSSTGGSDTLKTDASSTTATPSTPTASSVPSSSVPSSGETPSSSTPTETSTMSKEDELKKEAENNPKVYGSVPPRSNMNFTLSEDADAELIMPFLQALNQGSLRKAQALVDNDQQRFDAVFTRALQWYMTEQGITAANIRKLHQGAPSDFNPEDLKKAMVSTDIPGIYLMRLARLMLPVYAGIVRRLPAATPETGADKAQWRALLGFSNLSFANNLHVAEGAIGDEITETFLTFATSFRDLALNDKVTLKATAASRGYDDPLQVAVIRALTAILQLQERKVVGDNAAAITPPVSVTAVAGTATGALGTHTYHPKVTSLTYTGWLGQVKGGVLPAGSGETDATTGTSVVFGAGTTNSIDLSWASVPGAVAYNVYIDLNGDNTNWHWVATVTTNAYTILTQPAVGNAPPASNVTIQATGYEGLIQWCLQSSIYGNAIPNKVAVVDNAGGALTTNGSGITQFDTLLSSMWTNWQISPTLILTSSNGVSHYTSKIMTLNMPQYRVDVTDKQGQLVGGSFVTYYVNKFAPWADGSQRTIDLMAHPYMPDGTFLFLCESIPYPMSRESRGFARDTLIPYTYFPLAQVAINYPFAVTLSEAVECFHPSAQSAVVGVKVT